MSSNPVAVRTKVCFEDLFDKFKVAAERWLQETPEARSLLLLVDWKVGKDDFPCCAVVGPNPTELTTVDMMKQSAKLMSKLVTLFYQQVSSLDSSIRQGEHQQTESHSGNQT